MAGVATEESGAGRSFEGISSGQQQQCQAGEALAEWRSSEQVENGSPSTSPPYWDSDDDDDGGPKPSELYGKYTWKIDKFSQINKRELRSNAFEVGGYKWYILIYPQGCDVCNHLSLFLCVANHDKLLPGWSHFAQFTIAVVNKDPKKSKYSDTLHRFWKKEHDWGWKKFMELSKVLDGFIDADTLIIKAQVQVIRERADRPFRCLDCQYRRELVRVYLTNVEQICRRFVEERRAKLGKLIEDKVRWSSFCAFWLGMDQSSRRRMSREKTESILKVVVKHFFIEKEVTSTLVMDSLYSGLKALEGQNKAKKSKGKYLEAEDLPVPVVRTEKDMFVLVDDVLLLLERAALEPLPPKDEKGPQNRTKDGSAGEDFSKDSIERDERRLTELGRRTIEIFVLAHIFSKIEVAYQEAVALKKQEELIREEEAAWLAEIEQKARRGAVDKEKKSKKKQGKQKRNNRKGKDKGRDDKNSSILLDKIEQDSPTTDRKDVAADQEMVVEKSDPVEDVSDASGSVDCVPEILLPDSEDRDVSPVNWETDTSEVHPPTEASSSEVSGLSGVVQNGIEGRSPSAVDDSSSTCSSDSVPSVITVPHKVNSHHKNQKSPSRERSHQSKLTSDTADWANEERSQPSEAVLDARQPNDVSPSFNIVGSPSNAASRSLQNGLVNRSEQRVGKKEEETGSLQRNFKAKDSVDMEASGNKAACVTSPPRSPSKSIPFIAPPVLESKSNVARDPLMFRKTPSDSPKQADNSVLLTNSCESAATSKHDPQKFATPKPAEKPSGNQIHVGSEKIPAQEAPATTDKLSIPPMPVMSRPLSAPLVPGLRPSVSMVSMVQTAPALARSVSAAGRLGPEPTASATQRYVPQSYRNAIMGGPTAGSSSAYSQNHPAGSVVNASHSYSQPTALVSSPLFSPHSSDRVDPNPVQPSLSFGMVNHHDMLQNGPLWMERHQRASSRNVPADHGSLVNDMQSLNLYNPVQSRSHGHLPSELPACTSGRQNHVVQDEFPHLDIINDLLEDEHGLGMVARVNSSYQSFSNGPHNLNRHYSFPGDPSVSSGLGPSVSSCRFDRARSYHDDGFQHGQVGSGRTYDTTRDMIPQASRPYVNGQVDGFLPNQWQMAGSDMPYLSIRNMDSDGYPYHLQDYQNLSVGINGYSVFRPSSGL
ncbi:MATH domain-containing protein At5g43560-like [Sesamum indicum]|uniref:MATH domain-containing protein At5g43560-like n=1 Tax=Sesamum indicum TaxID=4182 RepID=A0A6I9SVN8_SESIN|nr:MATH domain-containing protein At5g43560-like [Sesamum indicum]